MPSPSQGALVDRLTQQWVVLTGREIDFDEFPWLLAPMGKPNGIGADFYDRFAEENGLVSVTGEVGSGLLSDFDILHSSHFDSKSVAPSVREFYQRTSDFSIETWSQWCSFFKPFGRILAWMFSRRLQQLNVPLTSMDSSLGMTSRIVQLQDPVTRTVAYTAWVREWIRTRNVLYAGNYSAVSVPQFGGPCVKVAFPLPNGNAVVVMEPRVLDDGSLLLLSQGRRFGDPGFYFTLHRNGRFHARYVRAFRESIHVYPAESACVRADHYLTLWGYRVLHIHYKLTLRSASL